MPRRTHWIDGDALEQLAYTGHYPIELGHDHNGPYKALTIAGHVEYRARLEEQS